MAHSGSGGISISTKEGRALEASKFGLQRRLGRYKLEKERAARRVQQPAVQAAHLSPNTSQNNIDVQQEKADRDAVAAAQIVHQKLVVFPSQNNYQTEFDDDDDDDDAHVDTTTDLNRQESGCFQHVINRKNLQIPPSPYGKSLEKVGRRQHSFGAASAPFANDHTWDKDLY